MRLPPELLVGLGLISHGFDSNVLASGRCDALDVLWIGGDDGIPPAQRAFLDVAEEDSKVR